MDRSKRRAHEERELDRPRRPVAERLLRVGLHDRGHTAMTAAADELLVERNAFAAERAILGVVRGEVATHQAEDRLAVFHLDRGPPPQAADADDLRAELLDQLDEQVQ